LFRAGICDQSLLLRPVPSRAFWASNLFVVLAGDDVPSGSES
jgi:hypothetical protein